jgi:lipoprotein-releasing system permease protein
MQAPFFIAKRYFFSKNKKNIINTIAFIAMGSVAVVTAALVIVMAGFNGMEELTLAQYNTFYPEIQVSPAKGKTFAYTDSLKKVIANIENIQALTEVIEDNVMLRYGEVQSVVSLKGVSQNFGQQYDLANRLLIGDFYIEKEGRAYMILGLGVYNQLSIDLTDVLKPLVCWYPKRQKGISLDPNKAFKKMPIMPVGAVSAEQQFDQTYAFVPLSFAAELMQYDNQLTSLEIKTKQEHTTQVQKTLTTLLGEKFFIKNRQEQQLSILRAIQIERLLVFFAFTFILALSSFNIFFSLAMLAIEKRKDIAILFSLGANCQTIKQIFLYIGAIIAGTGALSGLALGYGICFAQQQFGFVKLGISSAVVDSYPVRLFWTDFVAICLTVICVTLFASYIPANNATKVQVAEEL